MPVWMSTALAGLLVVLAAVSRVAIQAWAWRLCGARVAVEGDALITDVARFSYESKEGKLRVERPGAPAVTISLGSNLRLVVLPEFRDALRQEAMLSILGAAQLSPTDLLPAYRDKTKIVAIVLQSDTTQVPLVVLSQYRPYNFIEMGNDSMRSILSMLDLYRDIDAVAVDIRFRVDAFLRAQGMSVT